MSVAKELHRLVVLLAAPMSEFSLPFVQGMANRMAVSYHKYGLAAEAEIDHVACANQRIAIFENTGNPEGLMDAANFLMMGYVAHAAAFRATDSDESPGRVRADGSSDAERN